MYISSRSWHARVYMWWYRMKHGQYSSPRHINLCPYVRAILFWSWSRWLMRSGRFRLSGWMVSVPKLFWGAQPLWLLYVDYLIFGRSGFMLTLRVLGIAAAILSALSVLGLLIYGFIRVLKAEPVQDTLESAANGAVSFGRVIKEYAVGAHNKICPVLEFREEK